MPAFESAASAFNLQWLQGTVALRFAQAEFICGSSH